MPDKFFIIENSVIIFENIYHAAEDAMLIIWELHEDIKVLLKIKAAMRKNVSKTVNSVLSSIPLRSDMAVLFKKAYERLEYKHIINCLDGIADLDLIVKGVLDRDLKVELMCIIKKICFPNIN